METIDETALRNQAPLPNQVDCRGWLEARRISYPRCQRTIAEGIPLFRVLGSVDLLHAFYEGNPGEQRESPTSQVKNDYFP
jgi:hypothetical protein